MCIPGVLIFAAVSASLAAAEPAPPDASAYEVTVCLRPALNPLLTPLFIESVRRQVHDQLAHLFGPLARVQVLTKGHWLLDEFPGRGVDDPPINRELLSSRKLQDRIFLFSIDFRDGYNIAWRQIDGAAEYIGDVRRQLTPDRQWVAKSICLAVKDDFVLTADVKPNSLGGVSLDLHGGQHQAIVTRFLAEQSIWQPFWLVRQRSGDIQRRPIPETLIRLQRAEGNYLNQLEVISSLANPFPQRASIVGIQAMRLPVHAGRLRLRIVDSLTGKPVLNCSVSASDRDFDAISDADVLDRPDRNGYIVSTREFRQLAYVKVSTGGAAPIRIPLPVCAPLCEFEIKVAADARASEKNEFERQLRALTQDLSLLDSFQSATVQQVNDLNSNKRYEEAFNRLDVDLGAIQPKLGTARDSVVSLKRQWRQIDATAGTAVDAAEKQLQQRENRNDELKKLVGTLQEAISTRDAQNRANVHIKLAQQAEQEGNGEEAIARYEFALGERQDQPALREKLEKLKRLCARPSQARRLVYDRWAAATLTDIAPLLPEVETTVDALKSEGDHLSLFKLMSVYNVHSTTVNAFIEQVAARGQEADKEEAVRYSEIAQRLAALQAKVGQALDQLLSSESGPAATPAANAKPTAEEPPLP